MAKIFIIIFVVFILLGLAAVIHAAITAPTLDPETNRFIHWKKAKDYFKKKREVAKENAPVVEDEIAHTLLNPTPKKDFPRNPDGTFKKYKK